jgi:uncharacterized iron-regulated membrane protein
MTWSRAADAPEKKLPGVQRRGRFESVAIDAATSEPLVAARETRGGEFLYRLHFDLHYMPAIWARWIVGFCAMFMLVAIISGIVTHRRIFSDFFTFRPGKAQRSWLDAHNATAVLALPYHVMITYTGLITLMFLYMPWGPQVAYKGDQNAFFADVFPGSGARDPKPAGKPTAMVDIAPLLKQASAHWGGAPVGRITVNNPNDANATVNLLRQEGRDMSSSQPAMVFNATTGKLISSVGGEMAPAAQTRGVLYGLHIARFSNPFLRGLFFLCGLAGTVMVATGLLMWSVKERQKYAKVLKHGGRIGFGLRLVDGLNVAAIAGLPIAMATYFWANRLLPAGIAERPATEIVWFFGAWAAAAVAGLAWPARRMWQIQLVVGGALFALVPLLNALTTHTHLGVTLPAGMWAVAGFDLTCLGLGVALLAAAWWLGRRRNPKARHAKPRHDQAEHHAADGAPVPGMARLETGAQH